MLNVAVLISGGGSNLQALLAAAAHPDFPARIACVGADREAPGLEHARARGIPTFTVLTADHPSREAWGEALAEQLAAHGIPGFAPGSADVAASSPADPGSSGTADVAAPSGSEPAAPDWLVVSAGLMRILPAGFVQRFSPRLINTHPALLPLFPGAHAVRDALEAGATETGCTVHVIDAGVDTGPVLRQARVPIHPGESEAEVHERIKQLERPLLVETVRQIATGELELPAPGPATSAGHSQ